MNAAQSAHPLRRLRAFNLLSSPVSLAFLSLFAYNTTRKSPFPPSAGRKEAICLTAHSPPTKSAAPSLCRRCGILLPLTPTHPVPARLPVPSAWELVPALHTYRGRAHYTTRIRCGGNIRLSFGGVSFRARVLLDGTEIAQHYGAFTAFETVVRRLPDGEHALTVEVDNRFGEDSALHVPNDYYSYGGITRPVVIEQLPDVFVESVGITTKRAADGWTADISATVRNLADTDASAVSPSPLPGRRSPKPRTSRRTAPPSSAFPMRIMRM